MTGRTEDVVHMHNGRVVTHRCPCCAKPVSRKWLARGGVAGPWLIVQAHRGGGRGRGIGPTVAKGGPEKVARDYPDVFAVWRGRIVGLVVRLQRAGLLSREDLTTAEIQTLYDTARLLYSVVGLEESPPLPYRSRRWRVKESTIDPSSVLSPAPKAATNWTITEKEIDPYG